ncbi:DUF2069 domain-containing protein [uncultured Castellaniella sp.]|jgi:uncharacterized membrane protein|uniref:DUF2069 domain-containing protein n=1 Tax=uncultured Castellaniella sp. TaxID=647907 RepID=UPI0026395C05|nr:DUF2069 domain-containing protein [uncultured Castellaniella sp.]
METKLNQGLHRLACICLIALIVLCVGWELWWAPLRPGGTLMALKAVPLLFAVRGVLRARLYTLQWVAMLSLLYLMEGAVRAWSDASAVSAALAGVEIALSLGLYLCAILYVRPAKRAARRQAS